MNIKWNEIKFYTLNIGALSQPSDICKLFKEHNIDYYIYEIVQKNLFGSPTFTIKFGMSADNSRNYGERVYRQIAHCTSWGPLTIRGSSGADFFIIQDEVKKEYGIDLDHRMMELRVWDLTDYQFETIDYWQEICKIESYFIDQYKKFYGKKPIGNINDEQNNLFRPAIRRDTFESLFEVGK